MAQILRDPAALRQLDETELAGAIYEDYSQVTPFERGVGILADALEHWGAHGDGQHLRAGAASRRTTRDLEGRPYDITLHADGCAPAWPPRPPEAYREADFGPCRDWGCFFDAAQDAETTRTLRALFGMSEALVVAAATPPPSRLKQNVDKGQTLLVRAARDVVRGDHLDRAVDALVRAPEDVDARSRTVLAAAALALAQTRARVPVVVVERDNRTVVVRGASAARAAAADVSVAVEPGTRGALRAHALVEKLCEVAHNRVDAAACHVAATRTWAFARPPEPAFGASRVRQRWRAIVKPADRSVAARLAGAAYRRGAPLWGAARDPLATIEVQARWPPRHAPLLIDDAALSHPTSFDDLRAPAWTAACAFETSDAPLAAILTALSAAKLLADASDGDSIDRLGTIEVKDDASIQVIVDCARHMAGRSKTIVPERLDALVQEVFGEKDPRPAMDSDGEDEAEIMAAAGPAQNDAACAAEACCAHDMIALLALRCGGLSSLEAVGAVWSTFIEKLRARWDAKAPLAYKPGLPVGGGASRERSATSLYCGAVRVDACDAAAALATGGALQKLLATVDLAIRCTIPADGVAHEGVAVQVAGSPRKEWEADALARSGDAAAAASRRADLARATVASDIGAFKATFPQAPFAAFWRWARPHDFEHNLDRCLNVDPDIEALWDAVEATPGAQSKPLFDVHGEAEAALHALETARPRWVLGQLLACAASTGVFVLRDAAVPLASVDEALVTVDAACVSLVAAIGATEAADAAGAACASSVTMEAAKLIDAVAACEGLMGRATALIARLGDAEDAEFVAERLLAAGAVAVNDLEERRAVACLLQSYSTSEDLLPPPTLREYVLWTDAGSRVYASEDHTGEVCWATASARVD